MKERNGEADPVTSGRTEDADEGKKKKKKKAEEQQTESVEVREDRVFSQKVGSKILKRSRRGDTQILAVAAEEVRSALTYPHFERDERGG